ncbi:hypothetical protein G7046_g10173 [Stylonectria norvegica]|nr:hypothetical protein G7046_g10173 [Stylonectria norvegica]
MTTAPFLRWGLILSIAVLALAVAYRLQQPLLDSDTLTSSPPPTTTYCYKSIRTQDPDQISAQCFTVQDGIFTTVGSRADVATTAVEIIDGHVIPGLWDGHGHLLQYGEFLGSVDLFGSEALDDVRSRLRAYLDDNPGAGSKENWVRGVGWDQTFFGHMPTAVSHRIIVYQA